MPTDAPHDANKPLALTGDRDCLIQRAIETNDGCVSVGGLAHKLGMLVPSTAKEMSLVIDDWVFGHTMTEAQYKLIGDCLDPLYAERDRLAARVTELEAAVAWALGYSNFEPRRDGEGAYWWRSELRRQANMTDEACWEAARQQ